MTGILFGNELVNHPLKQESCKRCTLQAALWTWCSENSMQGNTPNKLKHSSHLSSSMSNSSNSFPTGYNSLPSFSFPCLLSRLKCRRSAFLLAFLMRTFITSCASCRSFACQQVRGTQLVIEKTDEVADRGQWMGYTAQKVVTWKRYR